MKKKTCIVVCILIVSIISSLSVQAVFVPYETLTFGGKAEVVGNSDFELQPNDQTVTHNDIFYINIYVTPNRTIDTCAVDNLTFTPNVLEVVAVTQGDLFGGTTMWVPYTEINNASGYVKGILWTWNGETDTAGVLCNITLKAASPGKGYVNFTDYGTARDGVNFTCNIISNATATVETTSFTPYATLSFGGKASVSATTIDVDVTPDAWIAGNVGVDTSIQENFTFYQNGSATIDITIGVNCTNFTFVNYTAWLNNGHDRYCANFTIDDWVSENMIEPGYPPSSVLKSSFAPGNFAFGVRIWMPRTLTYPNKQEDFKIVLVVSESS